MKCWLVAKFGITELLDGFALYCMVILDSEYLILLINGHSPLHLCVTLKIPPNGTHLNCHGGDLHVGHVRYDVCQSLRPSLPC